MIEFKDEENNFFYNPARVDWIFVFRLGLVYLHKR